MNLEKIKELGNLGVNSINLTSTVFDTLITSLSGLKISTDRITLSLENGNYITIVRDV